MHSEYTLKRKKSCNVVNDPNEPLESFFKQKKALQFKEDAYVFGKQ